MRIPPALLVPTLPMVGHVSVTVDGVVYRLSSHGKRRYIERVHYEPDECIIQSCIGNPKAVWKQEPDGSMVLVTVLR